MSPAVAVVTGANRGIGRCVAEQLADLGYTVVLASRSLARAREAVAELAGEGRVLLAAQVDVTQEQSVRDLAEKVQQQLGRVDVLINNAGVALDKFQAFEDTSVSVFEETLQVNTLGAFRVTQALLPMLRASAAPRIVNVSSQLGSLERMTGLTIAYRASKAALNAVTRSVAHELADTPAKVNSVCPGWVATELGGLDAPTTPAEGARGIVWAATLPEQGPTGGFFQQGSPLPW